MPVKGWTYAKFEGIVQGVGDSKDFLYTSEGGAGTASWQGYPTIDLKKTYGPNSVIVTGIDEMWYTAAGIGASLIGLKTVVDHGMYMANALTFDLIYQWASKLHYMHGGALTVPTVFVQSIAAQEKGLAGQHAEYEEDSWYMHTPGLKTVIPTTPYDLKGLMIAALRSNDPVVLLEYAGFRGLSGEVPDETYEVQIGKAAVRSRGNDITIVSSGNGTPQMLAATERLKKEGVSVEAIDLVTLHPLDTETLVKSVEKTKRLLTVDQSKYTLSPGAEVVARVAEAVPGAKFKRIAFPDAPAAAAPEMLEYNRINPDHVYAAAKWLLAK